MPPKGRGRGKGQPEGTQRPGGGQPQGPRGDAGQQSRAPGGPQRSNVPPQQPKTINPEELGFEYKCGIDGPLPRRPGFGKMGRPIKLITNCYKLKIPDGNVYHYDVEIISQGRSTTTMPATIPGAPVSEQEKKEKKEQDKYRCLSTKRNREVISQMLRLPFFSKTLAAYDGRKNMYTRYKLDIGAGKSFKVELPYQDADPNDPDQKMDKFEVKIQPVQKKETQDCAINLDSLQMVFEGRVADVPQDAVMAVETVLRNYPCQKYIPVGRSFYYKPTGRDIHPLGGGREIWFGYYQSLRLGGQWPMVNLDITASTFFQSGSILHHISEILNTDVTKLGSLRPGDVTRVSKELRNLRIEVTHLRNYRRKYRILRLVKSAKDLKFKMKEGNREIETSVVDYFRKQYQINLKYPNLPCIQANPETKKVYLPLEVCEVIEGQHSKKKLEEKQNAEMIKFTARAPKDRFEEIKDIVRRADHARDPYLQHFGIHVDSTPLLTNGRVLEAPSLQYKVKQSEPTVKVKPRDGQWDMRDKQYFRGAVIKTWMLLSFADNRFCRQDNLNHFAELLSKIAKEQGISMGRPELIEIADRRQQVEAVIENAQKRVRADLAVIVVPGKDKSIYGRVKTRAETLLGLVTQCIKDESVVKKCNPPLVSNLCQKINAKVGGINNALTPGETPAILSKPVIIIGADVTHPGPSMEIKPSIAALVGSLDRHPSRYAVTIRAQKNIDEKKQSIEIILELKDMVLDLMKAFYRSTNGHKPEKIIFFRDGVSEGQFDKVKKFEVNAIRQACRSLQVDYEPGITFVVVQKRHHTRFMPQDSRDGPGKMRNIPPGTTVDTVVTHPLNFDFFLCSHFGLQGTSRPCHYTVIEDDNKFTADDLQRLAYYLCHTYARCTKSISAPVPVMYAHLAAYRARAHLVTQMPDDSGSDSSHASMLDRPLPQEMKDAIKVIETLKNTMYFV